MRVVCVLKSGGDYHPRHVYALRDMCRRWVPHQEFICLTDFKGLDCATVALRHGLKGWWSKMELFDVFTEGETLYIDLDTIIRGECGGVIAATTGREFVILRDFYRGVADKLAMGSGVMFWNGSHRWLFDKFQAGGASGMRGDQDFLEQAFRQEGRSAAYWQDIAPDGVASYKADILGQLHPSNAPIVAFHGQPRPWGQKDVPYPECPQPSLVQIDQPCVIVGNGPGVLRTKMGATIDTFPQVVRINAYHTTGFEEHTGRKTTLHATHGKEGGFSQEAPVDRKLWLHQHATLPVAESWAVPQTFFWGLVKDWGTGRSVLPSSGFVATAWLLEQGVPCIHLAGFDHFGKSQSGLHHYWDGFAKTQPKEHSPEREQAMFEKWCCEGRVVYL